MRGKIEKLEIEITGASPCGSMRILPKTSKTTKTA